MTEKEIQALHDKLFNYLYGVHQQNPTFMFRVRRMNNQNRLDKRYWFNGNDSYLETSFWDYKDNLHQTPVIRLEYFFESKEWSCELVGRDSKERESYFKKMVSTDTFKNYKNDGRNPVWRKILEKSKNFTMPLEKFIEEEKEKFDTYIKDNPLPKLIDFIDENKFKKDIEKISSYKDRKKIKQEKISRVLPFALLYMSINDFQGITEEVKIGDDGNKSMLGNSPWIFFTGENGFGKTSILKAIAIGLTNDEERVLSKERVGYQNEIGAYQNKEEEFFYEYEWQEKPQKNDFKVVGYGVSRFLTNKNKDVTSTRTGSLFSDEARLEDFENILINNYRERENEIKNGVSEKDTIFERLRSILKKAVPNLSDIEVRYNIKEQRVEDRYSVWYIENNKDITQLDDKEYVNNYPPVQLKNLAAGYKSLLTMVGDMVVKLSDNLKLSDEISGVVIIDEIDAHLHPKYQYELPKLLSEAFPKVQFIVSTHSPIPLLGLPRDVKSVVFKVNRTVEEGITIDRKDDDFDIRQLNPEALLTSSIFDFQTLFARGAKNEEIIPTSDFQEVQQLNDLKELLTRLRQQDKLKKNHA